MGKRFINFWYKLSIRNKLLSFFAILIICPSALTMYSYYEGNRTMDQSYQNLQSYFMLYQLESKLNENKKFLQDYIQNQDEPALDQFNQSTSEIKGILEKSRENITSTDIYLIQKSVDNFWNSYLEQCLLAIQYRKEPKAGSDYYKPFFQALNVSGYLNEKIREFQTIRLSEGNSYFVKMVEKASIVKLFILIAQGMVIVLVLVFGFMFSNYLTKPIRQLAAASNQLSIGNMNISKIEINSRDEVGILAHCFNKMSCSIKQLVEDLETKSVIESRLHEEELKNLKMQELLKDAKFVGLQSQINPHYLFNTLNMISRTSMFEKAEKTTKFIISLSKIFRYHLEDHAKAVSLKKELDIIQEYMFIQNERFGGRIEVQLTCDKQLNTSQIHIPCFTIQPIVENGIKHGLETLERGGKLRISIRSAEDRAVIKIVDTGAGISKYDLTKILSDQEGEHTKGIGIANVMNRLKLFYEQDCLTMKSKPGFGTVVTISIPFKKEVAYVV